MKNSKNINSNNQRLIGFASMVIGFITMIISRFFSGNNLQDFTSGLLIGLSCGIILLGVYIIISSLNRDKDEDTNTNKNNED